MAAVAPWWWQLGSCGTIMVAAWQLWHHGGDSLAAVWRVACLVVLASGRMVPKCHIGTAQKEVT